MYVKFWRRRFSEKANDLSGRRQRRLASVLSPAAALLSAACGGSLPYGMVKGAGSVTHSGLAAMGAGDVAVRPPRLRRERAVRAYPSTPFTHAFGLLASAVAGWFGPVCWEWEPPASGWYGTKGKVS